MIIKMIQTLFKNIFIVWTFISIFVLLVVITILMFVNKDQVTEPSVATVNGEAIQEVEVDSELQRMKQFYSSQSQNIEEYSTLEKDTIEKLIERKLLTQYAQSQNISVSDDEIEKRYQAVLTIKSEPELLNELQNMYGIGKEEYLDVLYLDILKEKVQEKVGKSYATWIAEERAKADVSIEK